MQGIDMHGPIDLLRRLLRNEGCEAFISLSPPANEYLTGFHGTASAVIVAHDRSRFFCDFRYTEQAREQVRGCAVEEVQGTLETRVGERLESMGLRNVGFDPGVITVSQWDSLKESFSGALIPLPELLSGLRSHKTPEEVEKIRKSSQIAESALEKTLKELHTGLTEREFAARLEFEFMRMGAQKAAFDTIALFGARSSLPHGLPTDNNLCPGDIVLIDCGCIVDGYCSDLTRTYVFGRIPGAWFEEIYQVTLAAQEAACRALCAGAVCREVDAVARDIIRDAGYGSFFGHGLGHGVGLEIHEPPRLNMQTEKALAPGMVVTLEPGVYLPGRGGVRIEDLVVVHKDGCETLTRLSKELQVL